MMKKVQTQQPQQTIVTDSVEKTYVLPPIEEGGYYVVTYGMNGGVMVSPRSRNLDGRENSHVSSFFSKELDMIKAMIGYLPSEDIVDLEAFVAEKLLSRQTPAEPADLASKVQLAR